MFDWFRKKSRKGKEIPTLREAEEKLRSSAYPMMTASSEFKEGLKEKLLLARHQKSHDLMAPLFSFPRFPRFNIKLVPLAALVVLILIVLPLVLPYMKGPDRFVLDTAYAKDLFALEASVSDASGVSANTKFVFKSKVPFRKDELKSLLHFQPEVPFEIREISSQEFEIVPGENLEPEKVYQAVFEAFIKDEMGNLLPKKWKWAYQVRDEFKILKTFPGNRSSQVPVKTGIEITFSHPLGSAEELTPYFTITPQIAGRFEKFGRKIAFIPKEELKPLTLYKVTVKTGLTLAGTNQLLTEDYSFEFFTASPEQEAGISFLYLDTPYLAHFRTNELPKFNLSSYNFSLDEATVSVYALKNGDEFLARLSALEKNMPDWLCGVCVKRKISIENLPKVSEIKLLDLWQVEPDTNRTSLVYPVAFDEGFYVLSITQGDREFQTFFQVTDLAAYFLDSQTGAFILVHDAKTDQPVEKAVVEFTQIPFRTETDADGMVKFNMPELEKNASSALSFIKISKDGKEVWLPITFLDFPEWGYYEGSSYGSQDFWSTLSVDRPLYKPTDKVHFWGMAKYRKQNGPRTVTAKLAGIEQKLSVSDFGTFHGSFELRKEKVGFYSLDVYDEAEKLISSTPVTIQTFAKPAYEIFLHPRKKILNVGETVEVDVETKFFDGTPAPRVELQYDQGGIARRNYGSKITTDDRGKAVISIPTEKAKDFYTYGPRHIYLSLNVRPSQAEFGHIEASTGVILLAGDIEISARFEDEKLSGTVRELSPELYEKPFKKRPTIKNYPLTFVLEEVHWEKIETGEDYDPIEKKVQKLYRYEQRYEKVQEGSIETDNIGDFTITYDFAKNQDYRVMVTGNDRNGDAVGIQYYFTSGKSVKHYESYRKGLWLKKLDKSESADKEGKFFVREKARVQIMEGDEPSTKERHYLFFEAQKGIQKSVWQNAPVYAFTFEERHIPNVYIGVVFFENGKYEATNLLFQQSGVGLFFDEERRKLSLDIEVPKKTFRPGETMEVMFKATDPEGRPKRAELNVKLVDEALYAIADGYYDEDPLRDLYRYVDSGIIQSRASTDNAADFFGGRGGGGGGDVNVRFNFKDTAFFGVVETDENGKGSVSIKLPDNITRFRLTALGVTEDLYAGKGIRAIPISLPFFTDVTLNEAYTVYDAPKPRLRVFGDAIKGNEEVTYTVSSETLGMLEETFVSKASEPIFVSLPKLSLGNHSLTVAAKMGQYSDAVKHEFRVTESFMKIPTTQYHMLQSDTSFADTKADRAELRFSLFPYGKYYEMLVKHLYTYSSRLDAALAKSTAQKMLEQYFQKKFDDEEKTDLALHQRDGGGLGLFTYDDEDIELSAKAAFLAKDIFDEDSLASYFESIFDLAEDRDLQKKISRREIIYAFLGKAALGKAALNDARLFVNLYRASLNPEEKLVMAATFATLGDFALANELFEEVLEKHGKQEGDYLLVTIGETLDEHLEVTALALITASLLNHEKTFTLLRTVDENIPHTTLLSLEEAIALHTLLQQTPVIQQGSFQYTLHGKTEKVTLKNSDSFSLSLNDEELVSLAFLKVHGPVGVSIEAEVPYEKISLKTNADISIRRSYFVQGKKTTTLKENEFVKIVLEPTFKVAIAGWVEVVDVLPAGLLPLVEPHRFYYYHPEVNYPLRREGQRVYFRSREAGKPLTYYARVVSKGTFVADPARVQGIKNRSLFNVSEREEVTIE